MILNVNKLPFLTCIILFLLGTSKNNFAQDNKFEKWHTYINIKGEEVLKISAIRANAFSEGLARVQKYSWDGGAKAYNNYGFIDEKGKLVIPAVYEDITDFEFGIAFGKKRGEADFKIVNKQGEVVSNYSFKRAPFISFGLIKIEENGRFGFINTKGEVVIKPKYASSDIFDVDGLCSVAIEKDPNTWLYGFIDTLGNEVVPCIYKQDGSSGYSDGLARMRFPNGKIGYINPKGEVIIQPKYATTNSYGEGFYPVAFGPNRTKWGLVNAKNETVVPGKYDDFKIVYNGIAEVELNAKKGYIKTDGTIFIPLEYDEILYNFREDGLIVASKNAIPEKFDVILPDGSKISADSKRPVRVNQKEDYIVFMDAKTKAFGVMNFKGEIILAPSKFCMIGAFINGMAITRLCD
jgi:hypothetical protein